MRDFILLMHGDAPLAVDRGAWGGYFKALREQGAFEGGSSIGEGAAFRKTGDPAALTSGIGGYIRVQAVDLDAARAFLSGNPIYEAGGTVEIRELPIEPISPRT